MNDIVKAQLLSIPPEVVRQTAEETADPAAIVEEALSKLSADAGAMFEEQVIAALKAIRQKDEAAYARFVSRAKKCKTRLDKLTAPERDSHQDNNQDLILQAAQANCQFHHDADGRGVAIIEIDGHREVHLVDSQSFKKWLRAAVFKAHRMGIPDQAMNTAIATLNAIGNHDGNQVDVHLRCAKLGDAYFVDLCDSAWRVVRVDADGYSVLNNSPVLFIRTKGMRPLPLPNGSGHLEKLWAHINVPESRRELTLAWLLDGLRPDTPYPVLELAGEMGSAKSTAQTRLRDLIDPNEVALRSKPKTVEDIHIAATNSYVVSYENLSGLTSEQQDALCIISTGGGYSTRQMYTNGDEFVMKSKCPIMLNGINPVASQPDLIERTISVELPSIPPQNRQDDQMLSDNWGRDYCEIFSGLLDLFAQSLAGLNNVRIDGHQQKRMLAYQRLGESMCVALGKKPGYFSEQFDLAQGEGVVRGLETYGISNAIQVLLSGQKKPWEGTYLALLGALTELPGVDRSHWPKSARHLASQLKRIAPGLRRLGIGIERLERDRQGSWVKIFYFSP
jgi:hypothetical protein